LVYYEMINSGEATQKGFYKYEGKRKATPDPEIIKYIEKSRSMAGVTPDPEIIKYIEKSRSMAGVTPDPEVCFHNPFDCSCPSVIPREICSFFFLSPNNTMTWWLWPREFLFVSLFLVS